MNTVSARSRLICACSVCACFLSLLFFSCVSSSVPKAEYGEICSRKLSFSGIKTPAQLTAFFASHNPEYPKKQIRKLAKLYVAEGKAERINSDAAFVQMCLETGFLRFGNLVTADMHNYCGLGAMDAEHRGERFKTAKLGVRAHIQHLHAYATDASVPLTNKLVDPRYSWVHKAKYAATVFDLAGQWATDPAYGEKLNKLLSELDAY
ncbi:MAG: glucosaminidase domain-containing protein [Treponema sp.]|nr:glucosaminidase domain-containing protein [Treponema sp.]